jgi:hypothetical protein
MDLQTYIDNTLAAERSREMSSSDQLMFIELINKLESVNDKSKPIRFDNGEIPSCLGSWRGVYAELYIGFDGDTNSRNTEEVEKEYTGDYPYTIYKSKPTNLPETPTTQDMLDLCNDCLGQSFEGYKGGQFTMGKSTPVWVSQYGTTSGFDYGKDSDAYETKVVGVTELKDAVVIDTKAENYA